MDPVSVKMNLLRREEAPEDIREKLRRKDTVRAGGQIWIRNGDRIICCEDSEAGEDLARVLAAGSKGAPTQPDDPWLEILQGGRPPKRKIRDEARCVILFRAAPGQEKDLGKETFAALAPTEQGDAVTSAEAGTVALNKRVKGHSEEDISEFAAAMIDTIETETGIRATETC